MKKLKKKAFMEMLWEDRENRIWERRQEVRIEESGWERERILRGIKCGTMAKKHLATHKPKIVPPPRALGLDDEEDGDGQTLRDGTVLAKASNALSTFMPLYSEALRPYRVTKISTGFQHTLVCTDQGVCLSFSLLPPYAYLELIHVRIAHMNYPPTSKLYHPHLTLRYVNILRLHILVRFRQNF